MSREAAALAGRTTLTAGSMACAVLCARASLARSRGTMPADSAAASTAPVARAMPALRRVRRVAASPA
jgi:hypothetical protein